MAETEDSAPDFVPIELLTDEENASLRRLRFGALPARVQPAEMVELVETKSARDIPESAEDPRHWGAG